MDTYYCDSDSLTCSASDWAEIDLDQGVRPLPYMVLQVYSAPSWQLLGTTYSTASGGWVFFWNAPDCDEEGVYVATYFLRTHEDAPLSKYRFGIRDPNGWPAVAWRARSAGTVDNQPFQRSAAPGIWEHWANLYYTVNSALEEVVTWSSNLDDRFAGYSWDPTPGEVGETLDVIYDNSSINGSFANAADWSVSLADGSFNQGGNTRHELGHLVLAGAHGRKQQIPNDCLSYARRELLPSGVKPTHGLQSCEHGFAATQEGIATFFGVRSIVTNEAYNGAFHCFCSPNNPITNQDLCSVTAAQTTWPSDRQSVCPNGSPQIAFSGVGDDFATGRTHCAALRTTGNNACECPTDSTGDFCVTSWRRTHGYRNETNIARFLWDAIDTNDDSGFKDDLNESVEQLVANFEAMPCTGDCSSGVYDCGRDDTCNEPNPAACVLPDASVALPPPPAAMTGTRDSYNAYDLRQQIVKGPHGDYDEARYNCVDRATD